ncbi:unnamed protein product [Somion occarium]|uniref:Uncharacterized protein n=1 Tax=Somion occarium TaxID=3059160 RepID=A0ABP1DV21_9APHY
MSTPIQPSEPKNVQWEHVVGPINNKRKKAHLQAITLALGIDDNGKVLELVDRINRHIKEHHAHLSIDPRFQKLFVYRPDTVSSTKADSKETGKTSADRTAEDLAEQQKAAQEPTGAHKKLLDLGVSTDPPAQFERLDAHPSITVGPQESHNAVDFCSSLSHSSDGDLPSPRPTTPTNEVNNMEDPEELMMKTVTPVRMQHGIDKSVVVAFHDYHNHGKPAHEVWLPDDHGVPVICERQGDEAVFTTRLSDLLPVAIEHDTPVKSKGGRLYRAGFTASGSRISLGSLDTILLAAKSKRVEDIPKTLRLSKVNKYALREKEADDVLVCDIYLDSSSSQDIMAPAVVSKLNVDDIDGNNNESAFDWDDTGDKASGERATTPTATDHHSAPMAEESFSEFLRGFLGAEKANNKKAKTVGDILRRHLRLVAAIEKLEKADWARSTGGYQVPNDHRSRFAGQRFTKAEVHEAMQVKHSQANSDASLFKTRELMKLSEVQAWFNEPEGKYKKRFDLMSLKEFQEYKATALSKEKRKKVKKDSGKGKKSKGDDHGRDGESSKGKKRAERESSVSETEREEHTKKKSRHISINSDTIDSDISE